MPSFKFQAPSGTRDMYPADLLRRRYIEKLWRDTSIRHGFEEIDGPTFEHADLYAVKSGEGILSELFQVFSGKDAGELEAIRLGKSAPYALRPEFTPTLARMYAARAGSLPKPTRWFWMQNCYRAERQQRGRLREFGQWNCDILGTEDDPEARARADADLVAVAVDSFEAGGLTPEHLRVCVGDRVAVGSLLSGQGVPPGGIPTALGALDKVGKLQRQAAIDLCRESGFDLERFERDAAAPGNGALGSLRREAASIGVGAWCEVDLRIARGLAYYTGMVFEAIATGERAIAGGGRYDNLIELFGGPPTSAVGFGMGDVVLSLVLEDRGLIPEGDALLDALSRPSASYRPDVFVIPAGQTPDDQASSAARVRPLVAQLRRGAESAAHRSREPRKPWDADRYDSSSGGVPPLHARHSSKGTRNIGKLLQDAVAQKAKLAVILENAEEASIKDLRTGVQDPERVKIADVPREVAKRVQASGRPG